MGLLDGLETNESLKSALIRFGLLEMIRFVDIFYPGSKLTTFFESCGLPDLITACGGSQSRRVAEALVRTDYTVTELELDLLDGKRVPGASAVKEVFFMLKHKGVEAK